MRNRYNLASFTSVIFLIFINIAHTQIADTIAVAPFHVIGEKKSTDMFRYGFPDGLVHHLKQYENIVVVSRVRLADVMQELKLMQSGLLNTNDIQKVGEMLPASAIAVGSVYKSGNRLRVNMQLVKVSTAEILIEISEEGELKKKEDVFEFQEAIVKQFTKKLAIGLDNADYKVPTISMKAYDHFIKALSYLYEGNPAQAKKESEWTLQIDPSFNQAKTFDEEIDSTFKDLDQVIDGMK